MAMKNTVKRDKRNCTCDCPSYLCAYYRELRAEGAILAGCETPYTSAMAANSNRLSCFHDVGGRWALYDIPCTSCHGLEMIRADRLRRISSFSDERIRDARKKRRDVTNMDEELLLLLTLPKS